MPKRPFAFHFGVRAGFAMMEPRFRFVRAGWTSVQIVSDLPVRKVSVLAGFEIALCSACSEKRSADAGDLKEG